MIISRPSQVRSVYSYLWDFSKNLIAKGEPKDDQQSKSRKVSFGVHEVWSIGYLTTTLTETEDK